VEAFRVVYLASGLLFLAVALLGSAWWELALGEPAKPVLYVGLSPFGFETKLLGSQAIKAPPALNALFIALRALAVLGASTITAGALLAGKPWSRRLLNLRPFTMSIGFAIVVAAATMLLPRYALSSVPQLAQLAPNLAEALTPYSSGYLRVNLYPLTRVNSYLDLAFKSQLTLSFWVALLSGALCITGWILSKKGAREALEEAKPETKAQQPSTS